MIQSAYTLQNIYRAFDLDKDMEVYDTIDVHNLNQVLGCFENDPDISFVSFVNIELSLIEFDFIVGSFLVDIPDSATIVKPM